MSNLIVNNTAYAGEVVEKLLVRATTGNEIVDGGYVHVHAGIKSKLSLPRTRTNGKFLQRRVAMPKSGAGGDAKGDFQYSEKYLEPQDMMAYTEFNPAVFEHIWRPFQPTGEMVFQELPVEVQETLLTELAKVIDMELGDLYINCTKGAGARDFFNGLLSQMKTDTELTPVAGAHQITDETILPVLRKIKTSIPKALRKNKNVTIFMSTEDFDIYDAVITDKPFKGADYRNMNEEKYKGYSIAVLSDLPKDVIFVAVATAGIDSNLWIGVNLAEDSNAIQVGKVAPNGELYFFKMLMKADTNTVYGEDIVLWDGRGVEPPAVESLVATATFAASPLDQMLSTEEGTGIFLKLLQKIADSTESQEALSKAIENLNAVVENLSSAPENITEKEEAEPATKLTQAAIKKLNRGALEAFIAANELKVEIPEGMTNAQLADVIIQALGEEYFEAGDAGGAKA